MMNPKSYLTISGIGLMLAGLLVVLALAARWLWSGYWVALSVVDAIGLISPGAAAQATDSLSDSDILYFVFAEAPLYSLLLVLGLVLFVIGKYMEKTGSDKSVPE
jgi:hypothetical protein